jgi:hypothetical protein
MDKTDYDNKVFEILSNYRELRNDLLPELLKRTENTLKECANLIGNSLQEIRMSNPSLPRIKCLPKIHKPGNDMREIITANNAPTYKLARWLLKEFDNLNFQNPFSIKNSLEFVNKTKDLKDIKEDEMLVSFDVKSLFQIFPVL